MTKIESCTARIKKFSVQDIRINFPLHGPGSDANNPQTTYSNPYIILEDSEGVQGHGLGFTLGLGNELVCQAARELFPILAENSLGEIVSDFRSFWRKLANPAQRRWLSPNSGIYYMAAGALINALFDLLAKREKMPLWEFLIQLTPEQTIRLIDFRYVEHLLCEKEAEDMLRGFCPGRKTRQDDLRKKGLPCYFTTWIGSGPDEIILQMEEVIAGKGIRHFKIKVGNSLSSDREKLSRIRKHFGSDVELYVDANQVWSPPQAVEWIYRLSEFDLRWIEEPTAPDSIDGHLYVREKLRSLQIEVVTGENCPNSHVAAHFISSGAIDRFQIDACRVMGPPENILIILIAKKFQIPICPHAGGSGLDELVPHLSAWNEIALSGGSPLAITEHVALCSDHFNSPSVVFRGRLQLPSEPGYLGSMRDSSILKYSFPHGSSWVK